MDIHIGPVDADGACMFSIKLPDHGCIRGWINVSTDVGGVINISDDATGVDYTCGCTHRDVERVVNAVRRTMLTFDRLQNIVEKARRRADK